MAKVKITSVPQAKQKVSLWKTDPTTQGDELIFSAVEFDPKDIQLWAFKQNILIEIKNDVHPFMKMVFNSLLTE